MKSVSARLGSLIRNGNEQATEQIKLVLAAALPDQGAELVVSVTNRVPLVEAAYVIPGAIGTRLGEDSKFFTALGGRMTAPTVKLEAAGLLLDCMGKAARQYPRMRRLHRSGLREIVSNASVAPQLRARALRQLSVYGNEATEGLLADLLASENVDLVDAAAHLLAQRSSGPRKGSDRLDGMLARFALRFPSRALMRSGILRALSRTPRGVNVIGKLARRVRSDEHLCRLIGATDARVPTDVLADLIRKNWRRGSGIFAAVLRTGLRRNRTALHALCDHKYYDEYLWLVRRYPFLEDPGGFKRVKKALLFREKGEKSPAFDIPWSSILLEHGRLTNPSSPRPLATGYSSGFQIGDALYRDLVKKVGADHWHTGIYVGLHVQVNAEMMGVEASQGMVGISDTIAFWSASRTLPSRHTDLAAWAQQLREDFLTAFAGGRQNYPFHGARSTVGITTAQRRAVMLSATDLYGRNIWYTWADMLDYKGAGWSGASSDIDELRCDGVVEFAYEEYGLRACGGEDPNRRNQWNIAIRGTNHPENHNNVHVTGHSGSSSNGELCPRVQAGDYGNDSRFITPPPSRPSFDEFGATGWFFFIAPIIYFKCRAPFSDDVYVRILVRRKDAASLYCLLSEDPYGGMGTYVGEWCLMRASANDRISALWLGKTVGGPDFSGQDTTYEFRIQAIDEGGNVSEEIATEEYIKWP